MAIRAETSAILRRYDRRSATYDPLEPWIYMTRQELERAYIRWLGRFCGARPEDLRLLEVGCGSGGNLLLWLRLGLSSGNLAGNELQESLVDEARSRLPVAVNLYPGDALDVDFGPEKFDVVFQSLVFSSILDDSYQIALANKMWALVRPGGGILWYDFTYNNPSNADVRGVTNRRVRELFPGAALESWRVTLAPPVSRLVTKLHPWFYTLFNALPLLRTHVLCWIPKP